MLMPFDQRYDPLDSCANQLAGLLAQQPEMVAGLLVRFAEYGPQSRYSKLDLIQRGAELRLRYGRAQQLLPDGYTDTAAVSEVMIPGRDLHLFGDQTGPKLHVYSGDDWERDWLTFQSAKWQSPAGTGARFVLYSGACPCKAARASGVPFTLDELLTDEAIAEFRLRHTHPGIPAPLLLFGGALSDDHLPGPAEPRGFWTASVLTEFADYLSTNVLPEVRQAVVAG